MNQRLTSCNPGVWVITVLTNIQMHKYVLQLDTISLTNVYSKKKCFQLSNLKQSSQFSLLTIFQRYITWLVAKIVCSAWSFNLNICTLLSFKKMKGNKYIWLYEINNIHNFHMVVVFSMRKQKIPEALYQTCSSYLIFLKLKFVQIFRKVNYKKF